MATDLELSDVWRELQRNGSVQSGSLLTKSCERELIELMRQIDILMRGKRIEWGNEKAVLNMRIESKEKECALQNDAIEKRDKEIGRLREQLSNCDINNRKLISEYQQQMEQLRSDLSALKKHYDRLRAKYNKHRASSSKEKSQKEDENSQKGEIDSEIWARERKLLQQEVDSLSAQMKALVEKCQLLENSKSADGVVHASGTVQMSADLLRDEVYRLKCCLHESQDREAEKSVELARLKSDLSHWRNKASKYSQERTTAEENLQKAFTQINNLQQRNNALTRELQAHDNALGIVIEDKSVHDKELIRLKESLYERDQTIKSLLEKNHNDESAALNALKEEIMVMSTENRGMLDRENKLQDEILQTKSTLQTYSEKLEQAERRCQELSQLVQLKESEMAEREAHVVKLRENELNVLQTELYQLKDSHSAEKSALEAELDSLKKQLNELASVKPSPLNMISLLTDSTLRSVTPDHSDSDTSQYVAELRITQKQLDAVRLENRHLKEQIVMSSISRNEVKFASSKLMEIENNHSNIIKKLQVENEKLRQDMQSMKDEMQNTRDVYHQKYQTVLKEMFNDIVNRDRRLYEEPIQQEVKYTTPGTVESGYRSQLNAPSTGKEKVTPAEQERCSSKASLYSDKPSDIREDFREQARLVKKLIEDESMTNRTDTSLADQSYSEVTAESTHIDDKASLNAATQDHTTSEYMSVAPRLSTKMYDKNPSIPISPVKSSQSEYVPSASPSPSAQSTSTKKSSRSSKGHIRSFTFRTASSCDRQSNYDTPEVIRSASSENVKNYLSSLNTTRETPSQIHSAREAPFLINSTRETPSHLNSKCASKMKRISLSTDEQCSTMGSASKYYDGLNTSDKYTPSTNSSVVIGLLDNSHFTSRPGSAAEKFLEDQRHRTSALEKLLDQQIFKFGSSQTLSSKS